MNATFVVSQRAEMQQDLRASDLLFKDISLAGAGMPSGSTYDTYDASGDLLNGHT